MTEIVWPEIPGIRSERAVLVRWLRQDGDAVKPGDVLALVDTSDASVEIESEYEGVLRHVTNAGAKVSVGETFGRIEADPATWPPPPQRRQ